MAKRTQQAHTPPAGRVALVAGATRGAGRGIARALGEAGAIVYCTGRSVKENPSPYNRPETIDETAEMIAAAGGTAIPLRVDHSVESEVEALFAQIDREQGRIDIVVNSVAGEDPLAGGFGWFWDADLTNTAQALENSLLTHIITAKHAARAMIRAKSGLIVEVTEGDSFGSGGNPVKQVVKLALKGNALAMATELYPHGVAAVSITPGFLRSETMLEHFGVTEENWRDAGRKDRNFLESESPLYIGRAVAALAADPNIMKRTGQLFSSWELARDYGFTDVDGRRPDWGRLKLDFSGMPPDFLTYFRIGNRLTLEWLERVTARLKTFSKQLPPSPKASARQVRKSPKASAGESPKRAAARKAGPERRTRPKAAKKEARRRR